MIAALSFLPIVIGFFVLMKTFQSVSRLEGIRLSTGQVQWKRALLCYLCGTQHVTGSRLRPGYGYALLLLAPLLYVAAFNLGQRFDHTLGSAHFLLLSRLANILCQLCDWPALAFCLEYLSVSARGAMCVAGCILTGFLLLINPVGFFGLWPPFMHDYFNL